MLTNYIKLLLGLIIITAAFPAVMAGPAQTDAPYLKLLLEEVTPEPVEPGQDVTVKIRVLNQGGEAAQNLSVKLHADDPFYLKTTSEDPAPRNDLCVGCSMDNTYYLTVDADAESGMYPLSFEMKGDNVHKKPEETVDIKVVGKPHVILRTDALQKQVSSGERMNTTFNLENIGTGIARNIRVIPQSEHIMMLGSNIHVVDHMHPGEEVSFDTRFSTKENLKPNNYRVPIHLQYSDEQSASYTDTFHLGTQIQDRAEVGLQSFKTEPTLPTAGDVIHMEGIIENTGSGEADDVTVRLNAANNSDKAFLGQLKADDDAPFYFDTRVQYPGNTEIRLKVSYQDDFGVHEFEKTLQQKVQQPRNNLLYVLGALFVVLIGLGYLLMRRK